MFIRGGMKSSSHSFQQGGNTHDPKYCGSGFVRYKVDVSAKQQLPYDFV
jgi:hypothetical protein